MTECFVKSIAEIRDWRATYVDRMLDQGCVELSSRLSSPLCLRADIVLHSAWLGRLSTSGSTSAPPNSRSTTCCWVCRISLDVSRRLLQRLLGPS